jgi:hypothetical protein
MAVSLEQALIEVCTVPPDFHVILRLTVYTSVEWHWGNMLLYRSSTRPQEFGSCTFSGEFVHITERKGQMRFRVKHYIAGLAVLTLTMPVCARTYKESMTLDKNSTIGSAQLKPGSYQLTADDTKKELNILQNGKIIATVQGQWVKIPQKAQAPSVDTDHDKITQVQFSGSDQAFQPL